MKKALTQEQKDKAANTRLLKTYNISLTEYESMLATQSFGCAICGKPPTDNRLHVDHCHKFDSVKLVSVKTDVGWQTSTPKDFVPWVMAFGKTKSLAIKAVKQQLKRMSVRGLLDWKCNAALQKFQDNPDKMEAAAQYLRNFNSKYKEQHVQEIS